MGLETHIGEKSRCSHTQLSLTADVWTMFSEDYIRSAAFSRQTDFLMNSLSEVIFFYSKFT